ncbi:MAG: DUF2169 domain-containing protein, partial [Polyangiales bacterium]
MELVTSHPLSLGVLRWSRGTEQRLTVIAKLTFDLSRQGASLIDPLPLHGDVHHENNEGRSLALANDFVPRRAGADVVFRGHAWAKPGERSQKQTVRLVISEGTEILLDKSLEIASAEPFRELPIRYELATDASATIRHPEGATDTADPAGFGPIATNLEGIDRSAPALAPTFDFAIFTSAPRNQRVRPLTGREEIRLVGLHPGNPDVRSKLPGLRPQVTIERMGGPIEVPMVGDTLAIEGDDATCSITFRGDVPYEGEDVRIVAQIVDEAALRARKLAARSRALSGTERDVAPPLVLGRSAPQAVPTALPTAAVPGRDKSFTATMEAPNTGAPFAFPLRRTNQDMPALVGIVPAPPPVLDLDEAPPSLRVPVPQDDDEPPPSSMVISAKAPRSLMPHEALRVPPRVSETVPILNASSFVPFTLHWCLRPPRDALIVAVKATYDLVAGGPAVPAAEQDLPSGDLHWDDNPLASLRYPSDFAPFKPKADVLLVGSAHRAQGRGVTLMRFRFGPIERRIAVFGDRTRAKGPQAAEPFETMDLRWERARGGPSSKENPVGIGSSEGLLLPNLEDADALIGRGSDVPACTAPISPSWPQRIGKLGTYDARWLATRWPWFPEDFEWAYFNAAPLAQQIEYPQGDETFVLAGVLPKGEVLEGRMPEKRPRAFAVREDGTLFEVVLRIDTVWFDAAQKKLVLVFRGLAEVEDPDAMELSTLFVLDDEPGLDLERARKRLHVELFARGLAGSERPRVAEASPANDLAGLSLGELYQRMQRDLERTKEERGGEEPRQAEAEPVEVPIVPPMSAEEVLAAIRAGASLAGRDLSGVKLDGADLRGVDLAGAILTRAELRFAKLDGARLASANLSSAQADDASFVGADLASADFTGASLERANLSTAKLDDTLFESARANHAIFGGAKGERAIFTRATLVEAFFEKAQLPAADFTETMLEGARFADADLTNVRLY